MKSPTAFILLHYAFLKNLSNPHRTSSDTFNRLLHRSYFFILVILIFFTVILVTLDKVILEQLPDSKDLSIGFTASTNFTIIVANHSMIKFTLSLSTSFFCCHRFFLLLLLTLEPSPSLWIARKVCFDVFYFILLYHAILIRIELQLTHPTVFFMVATLVGFTDIVLTVAKVLF